MRCRPPAVVVHFPAKSKIRTVPMPGALFDRPPSDVEHLLLDHASLGHYGPDSTRDASEMECPQVNHSYEGLLSPHMARLLRHSGAIGARSQCRRLYSASTEAVAY